MTDDQPHHHGAFFGRRKGHPLRAHQAALFDTLLPRLVGGCAQARARSRRSVSGPVDDIRLEIGFGGGEHLITQALDPRVGFIGCEPFVNGMAKALAAIDAQKIHNVRLHHADAVDLLDWLPRKPRSAASICSIPIPGQSGATGSGVSSTRRTSRGSRACCARAANSASPPTGRTMPNGRCCASRGATNSPGPPSAPTTGASRGQASRRRATKRRRSARGACPATSCSGRITLTTSAATPPVEAERAALAGDVAEAGEMHVHSGDQQPLLRRHVEQPAARRHGGVRIGVRHHGDLGRANCTSGNVDRVAPHQQALIAATR